MSALGVTAAGGFVGAPGERFSAYVTDVDAEHRERLLRSAGVKHARLVGSAASFAVLAGKALPASMITDNTGIICTGGPWALPAATTFIERANEAGARFVNSLQFPATLPSATATIAAAVLGTHAFAYVIGHDRLAFFEGLQHATSALRFGLADHVLVIATSSSEAAIERARTLAGLPRRSLDVSIGFVLTAETRTAPLELLGVYLDAPAPENAATYQAEWDGAGLRFPMKTPLQDGEAYCASGAIVCLAAAWYHSETADPAQPFAVRITDESGRSGTAVFRMTVAT